MLKVISSAEKEFIRQGCEQSIRGDGRANNDFRPIIIENSVLPHVHGSSRVKLETSMTVMCTVRVSVSDMLLEKRPFLEINTKLTPSNIFKSDANRISDVEIDVSDRLYDILAKSKSIDFPKLCIIPNKYQWVVAIDLIVLNMDCDPTDACSLAINAALQSTKVPKHQLTRGETGEYEDFEISSHLGDSYALPLSGRIPICVTCFKIGGSWVLDCDCDEQACASSGLIVALSYTGSQDDGTAEYTVCGVQKILSGSISAADSLEAIQRVTAVIPSIFGTLDSVVQRTIARDSQYPDVPSERAGLLF